MKHFNFVHILITLIYFSVSNLSWAADIKYEQVPEERSEIIKLLNTKSSFSPKYSGMILAKDSDRGCCVYKTEKKICTFTNEKYCRESAEANNVKFNFRKNKLCRELPACK